MRKYNNNNANIISGKLALELGLSDRARRIRPCAKCTEAGEILETYATLRQACEKNFIASQGNLSRALKDNDGLPHYLSGYYFKNL